MNINQENPFNKGKLLLVDKPSGWTSFDVVNKIRFAIKKAFSVKKIKVGHAGTLDPMATGLLIICTGKMTKQIHNFQSLDKTYSGSFRLGATTPSYDKETEIDNTFKWEHITSEKIQEIFPQFIGCIKQRPPAYSAIKKGGVRSYKLARKGIPLSMQEREVLIHSLQATSVNLPDIFFKVTCSKGTYIRSLAYDLGIALNSGAYLTSLVREQIGNYKLSEAWQIPKLLEMIKATAHEHSSESSD